MNGPKPGCPQLIVEEAPFQRVSVNEAEALVAGWIKANVNGEVVWEAS